MLECHSFIPNSGQDCTKMWISLIFNSLSQTVLEKSEGTKKVEVSRGKRGQTGQGDEICSTNKNTLNKVGGKITRKTFGCIHSFTMNN